MVSKARMTELVKAFAFTEVDAGLAGTPALLGYRDQRGRNWLHLCCGADVREAGRSPEASVRTADVLLGRGLDKGSVAFTEGDWKATPVWYAIGWGRNHLLAEHLLKLGANPNYSLFAAGYNRDLEAIRLLIRYGATVDEVHEGETPFLGLVGWSHFEAAEELLRHGADPNARDAKGRTALHMMLKKGSDAAHVAMLLAHGARTDIPGPDGVTAAEILRRKKDPKLRRLAERLQVVVRNTPAPPRGGRRSTTPSP